ncbi:MAG: hypothetical protein NVSMB3_04420 [Acidobacteriaceae bacterium]
MSTAANLYPAPGAAPATGLQETRVVHVSQDLAETLGQSVSGAAATNEESKRTATSIDAPIAPRTGKLVAFEGFLKKAGHIAGVVLTDIVKYAMPVASLVAVADPETAPAVAAFTASVRLVQATVVSVQQKWATSGSEANPQKLADVLEIVEQPVLTMFAQAGVQVDKTYVTNLVNGIVAILNAQPGAVLQKAAA